MIMNTTEHKDKIEELVGPSEGCDQMDTFAFFFYKCSKFGGRDVAIDLEKGTLEVYAAAVFPNNDDADTEESDNVGVTTVEESYEIKYTLERR